MRRFPARSKNPRHAEPLVNDVSIADRFRSARRKNALGQRLGARVGIVHDFIAKTTNAAISPW